MSARVPKYRADAKGELSKYKADCIAHMRSEIARADFFVMSWDDCESAVSEWSPFLTDAELACCFKNAIVKEFA
jgi:hypothetical protein